MRLYYSSKISQNMSETPEGFLICHDVPIARTGYQEYLGHEIGAREDIVKVYRPSEEVFSPKTLSSFEGKTFTNDHPCNLITKNDNSVYDKGHAQNIRRNGEFVIADIFIKDPCTIDAVKNGKREISAGYDADIIFENGRYITKNIIGNHIALVEKGRAGAAVAIKDDWFTMNGTHIYAEEGESHYEAGKRFLSNPEKYSYKKVNEEALKTQEKVEKVASNLRGISHVPINIDLHNHKYNYELAKTIENITPSELKEYSHKIGSESIKRAKEWINKYESKMNSQQSYEREKKALEIQRKNQETVATNKKIEKLKEEQKNNIQRQYLEIPYKNKEKAKKLGAKWDPEERLWYMPLKQGERLPKELEENKISSEGMNWLRSGFELEQLRNTNIIRDEKKRIRNKENLTMKNLFGKMFAAFVKDAEPEEIEKAVELLKNEEEKPVKDEGAEKIEALEKTIKDMETKIADMCKKDEEPEEETTALDELEKEIEDNEAEAVAAGEKEKGEEEKAAVAIKNAQEAGEKENQAEVSDEEIKKEIADAKKAIGLISDTTARKKVADSFAKVIRGKMTTSTNYKTFMDAAMTHSKPSTDIDHGAIFKQIKENHFRK